MIKMLVKYFGMYQHFIGISICILGLIISFIYIFLIKIQVNKIKGYQTIFYSFKMIILWVINYIFYLVSPTFQIARIHIFMEYILLLIFIIGLLNLYVTHKVPYNNIRKSILLSGVIYIIVSLEGLWTYIPMSISIFIRPLIVILYIVTLINCTKNYIDIENITLYIEEILNNVEDIIYVMNKKGHVIYRNTNRYNISDIDDFSKYTVINPINDIFLDQMTQCMKNKNGCLVKGEITLDNINKDTYSAQFYAYKNKGDKIGGYILTLNNISDLKFLIQQNEIKGKEISKIKEQLEIKLNTEDEIVREEIRIHILQQIRKQTINSINTIYKNISDMTTEKVDTYKMKKIIKHIRNTIESIRNYTRSLKK